MVFIENSDYDDDQYGDYYNIDCNEVSEQIEALEQFASRPGVFDEKIAHYQSILFNTKFAMDYRYEAISQLTKLIDSHHHLVIPILIDFLETDESEASDPNYQLSKTAGMISSMYDDSYCYSDDRWLYDVHDEALYALNSEYPETKEAVHVLVFFVKKYYYCESITSAIHALCALGERYQDVRYIITANLYEDQELNDAARFVLDYLEEYNNQLDGFVGGYFQEHFFASIFDKEKYYFLRV